MSGKGRANVKEEKYINLDVCVENALTMLSQTKLPRVSIPYKRPLIIGSGNAAVTGKIIFEDKDAIFADESNYAKKLKAAQHVDGVVLISASGGKHAPLLAEEFKKKKLPVTLITNNANALAIPFTEKYFVLPKNPEPYTYNTSTYLSIIFAKTRKDPKKVLNFIKRSIKPKISKFEKFDAFLFIVPNELDVDREMFQTKFDELFGPMISARVFTEDQVKHAKTIVSSKKECIIGLGVDNKIWGLPENRYNFKIPEDAGLGGFVAIGYWIIGQIQKQKPQYFKQGVEKYTKEVSKLFKQDIQPLVK